jgi:phospholipid/cholesterol/gamma-HCH transport system substrate-binding protein
VTRRNEVVVGVVVLAGVLLAVFGTIWMQGLNLGREQRPVQARFREVGQLLTGSNVKFRGVPIGRVESIELEPGGGGVIVTMSVDGDVRLPEDPVVILAPESLFGDWQAEIAPRSLYPGYRYAEAPDPAVLPGYALPDMVRLTAVADQIASNLATISTRFEEAFTTETANNIRLAIENIQEVSEQLTGLVGKQQLAMAEVARDLERTSEAAGQAAIAVQRAFSQIDTAIGGGALQRIVSSMERTTGRTDSLVSVLLATTRDLRITATTADTALRNVGQIAAAVRRGEGTLGKLLRDTTLYMSLVETNVEVQALLRDIRRNPRRYINLRVF